MALNTLRRKPPIPTIKPATLIHLIIQPHAPHPFPPTPSKRRRQSLPHPLILPRFTSNKRRSAYKPSRPRQPVANRFRYQQHTPKPTHRLKRKQQSPPRPQGIQPRPSRLRHPRIDIDHISGRQPLHHSRPSMDRNPRPGLQILLHPIRQPRIDLKRMNPPRCANEMSQNRRIIPAPSPNLHHRLPHPHAQRIQTARMQAGFADIDPPSRIECNPNILIGKRRIVIRRPHIAGATRRPDRQDRPRPRSSKNLPRHRRKRHLDTPILDPSRRQPPRPYRPIKH